jgi:uncharacterized repeat protein (TIGR02543 family)
MKNKLLSALLSVCLLLTLLPTTALAAGDVAVYVGAARLTSSTPYTTDGLSAGTDPGAGSRGESYALFTIGNGAFTLTLHHFSYSGAGYADRPAYNSAAIYNVGVLDILLEGENSVTHSGSATGNSSGVYSSDTLTIKGDGSLTATGGTAATGSSCGISCGSGTVRIQNNAVVNATGGTAAAGSSYGISCDYAGIFNDDNSVTISGGTVIATGGSAADQSCGIYCNNSVVTATASVNVSGGTVNAVGGAATTTGNSYGIYSSNAVNISGGTVNANGGAATAGSSCGIRGNDAVNVSGGTVHANGGRVSTANDSYNSYGIYSGSSVAFSGGITIARAGQRGDSLDSAHRYAVYCDVKDEITLTDTQIAGAVQHSTLLTLDGTNLTSEDCTAAPKKSIGVGGNYATGTVIVPTSFNEHISTTAQSYDVDTTISADTAIVARDPSSNHILTVAAGKTVSVASGKTLLVVSLVEGPESHGIFGAGALELNGAGNVIAVGGLTTATDGGSKGVYAHGPLTVKCRLTAIGGNGAASSKGIEASSGESGLPDVSLDGASVIALGSQTGYSDSYGSVGIEAPYTISINNSTLVALGSERAMNTDPALTYAAVVAGAYDAKLCLVRPVSVTPAADTATVAMTSAEQTSLEFTLTTMPDGTYKAYTTADGSTEAANVSFDQPQKKVTVTGDPIVPQTVYIAVTEAGKLESARLCLTVGTLTRTVTFSINGHGTAPAAQAIISGEKATLPAAPTAAGYTFGGWYKEEACVNAWDFDSDTVTADTTLYAKWTSTPVSSGGSSGGGSAAPAVSVVVDGKTETIGKSETTSTETKVTVDSGKLTEKVGSAEAGASVVVPVADGKTTATAQLVVKNVEDMAKKEMTLTVQTGGVSYELPTAAIDTGAVLGELGATDPAKVPVNVTITKTDAAIPGAAVIGTPTSFTVTASYGGKTVEVTSFEQYVARVIEVTAEQAKKITTAIVKEPDGTLRHVPTFVTQKDGRYYAQINSLTNSTYALIENEVRFADAEGQWYEAVVNEMASRKILNGRTADCFDGTSAVTRAQFASIIVRALGLPSDGTADFTDVRTSDWFCGAVGTASAYGLVNGYADGSFQPNATITRQEAMAIMQRAAKTANYAGASGALTAFSDADKVSRWAQSAAEFNVGSGLILGSNGALRPNDKISRAETATVILRLLQKAALVDVRANA